MSHAGRREIVVNINGNLEPTISGCPPGYSVQVYFSYDLAKLVRGGRHAGGVSMRRGRGGRPSDVWGEFEMKPEDEDHDIDEMVDSAMRKQRRKRKSASGEQETSSPKRATKERRGRKREPASIEILGDTNKDKVKKSDNDHDDGVDEEEDFSEKEKEHEDGDEDIVVPEEEADKDEDEGSVVMDDGADGEGDVLMDDGAEGEDDDDDQEEQQEEKEDENEDEGDKDDEEPEAPVAAPVEAPVEPAAEVKVIKKYYVGYDQRAMLRKTKSTVTKPWRMLKVMVREYRKNPETGKAKFNSVMDEPVCTLVVSNPQGPRVAGSDGKPSRWNTIHDVFPGRTTDMEKLQKYETWRQENPELNREVLQALGAYKNGEQKIPLRDTEEQ